MGTTITIEIFAVIMVSMMALAFLLYYLAWRNRKSPVPSRDLEPLSEQRSVWQTLRFFSRAAASLNRAPHLGERC